MTVRIPRIRVHGWRAGSKSARALSRALGVRSIKNESTFIGRRGDTIVNYGSSSLRCRVLTGCRILNHPSAVELAANKLFFFRALRNHENIQTVPTTESYETASSWLRDGSKVYCRTSLTGHSGDGIVIGSDPSVPLPVACLYSKAITGGRREYRFHIINEEMVLVQQKRRRSGWEDDPQYCDEVRNLSGGWIFSSENVTEYPEQAPQMAIDTIKALGLDFGSVDMITQHGECYVLEVNTASGLGNEVTINTYADKILEMIING